MFGSSANATIKNCTSSVTVKSTNPSTTTSEQGCGGFVGKIVRNTSIDNCQFTGKVDGVRLVGGIAGWAVEADNSITNSFNTAAITATKTGDAKGERTGGIIGHLGAGSFISKCYNSGSISGTGMQGGIAGYLEGNKSDSDKGYIEKCYSTGNITCKGGNFAGGICAYMQSGEISNCYTKNGSTSVSGQSTGGIVGEVIVTTCQIVFTGGYQACREGSPLGTLALLAGMDMACSTNRANTVFHGMCGTDRSTFSSLIDLCACTNTIAGIGEGDAFGIQRTFCHYNSGIG
jgi:hypothetical protein